MPSQSLNFSDWDAFAVKTPTLTANARKRASFSKKRGYPDSDVTTNKHRAQEIDRETALQTSQNEETDRIPYTYTYQPQNLAIKNVILTNFKILRNDPETKHIFSLPPLISFKRDKNLGNFLARSAFKFNSQPGTFSCKRTGCKTCPFISSTVKISGPSRSFKVADHFTCISINVIYCITCTLCKKIYICQAGRRLASRFRKHPRDVQKKNNNNNNTEWCLQTSRVPFKSSLSLPPQHDYLRDILTPREHTKPQKSRTKIHFSTGYTFSTRNLMNASHSTNVFTNSCDHISTNGKAPLHSHINHNTPQFLYSLWRRANAQTSAF